MSEPDLDALVDRLRAGEVDALAQYIELHRSRLLAYIDHQLGNALRSKIEADDVLQETSADACRSLGAVDLSARDPFGWLCQIAQRRIIDAHRKLFGAQRRAAGREVSINKPAADDGQGGLIDLLTASMTTASQAFSRNVKEMRLQDALKDLPDDQREALQLRYGQGLPSKDIAERLGKSDGAVRVMLTRALNTLREKLGTAE